MQSSILFLNLFVIFNLTVMTIAILLKKDSFKANFWLALIIYICLHTSVNNLLFNYFRNSILLTLQMSLTGLNFSFGCALFAYSTLLHEQKLPRNWYWHFAPAVILFLGGLYYLFLPNETIQIYLHETLEGNHVPLVLINALLLLHILFYLIVAKRKIILYRKEKRESENIAVKVKQKWANDFVNYMIINTIVMILSYTVAIAFFSKTYYFCDLVILPIVSLSVYSFIVYKNFQHTVTFENITKLNQSEELIKEKILILNEEEKQQQEAQLSQIAFYLSSNQSYKKPELSLQKFAEEVRMSPLELSQTINQGLNMSFVDMVNKYRVDEAKSLLVEAKNQHLKIEAIGKMAGFSSRSSFFSVFKKHTGLTPSQYKSL